MAEVDLGSSYLLESKKDNIQYSWLVSQLKKQRKCVKFDFCSNANMTDKLANKVYLILTIRVEMNISTFAIHRTETLLT